MGMTRFLGWGAIVEAFAALPIFAPSTKIGPGRKSVTGPGPRRGQVAPPARNVSAFMVRYQPAKTSVRHASTYRGERRNAARLLRRRALR